MRPLRQGDEPLLWPAVSDPVMTRHLTWNPHRHEGDTRLFVAANVNARAAGREVTWIVFEEGLFRGLCGIDGIVRGNQSVRMDRGELGYWIATPQQGRGIASEAAGAAVACAFRRIGLRKVVVRAILSNEPSLRVIRKLGFREVGVMREDILRRGRWRDVGQFEMLRSDPAARALLATHH